MIRIKSFSQNTVLTFCQNINIIYNIILYNIILRVLYSEYNINVFTENISQRSRLQTTEVTLAVEAGRDLLKEH